MHWNPHPVRGSGPPRDHARPIREVFGFGPPLPCERQRTFNIQVFWPHPRPHHSFPFSAAAREPSARSCLSCSISRALWSSWKKAGPMMIDALMRWRLLQHGHGGRTNQEQGKKSFHSLSRYRRRINTNERIANWRFGSIPAPFPPQIARQPLEAHQTDV
ncbi:uncharacterized protein PV09_04694 [Verruconis gallopava]|uniref:Uncharacterized protein n=1 Tax=Verruconis gallopava TaxID=253628 RepID=A0A0D1YUS8_9PEZI|nr:uncharacterized protein PV09_04694 [Verruconis gallopava]KIW04422.1 hypothetical protein PV09_04694 [Verruconis gallopava]